VGDELQIAVSIETHLDHPREHPIQPRRQGGS
jgi:hypothetical protein